MAGTIKCFSILYQEHPILHELTINAEEEREEGEAPEFTQPGSVVTVSEPAPFFFFALTKHMPPIPGGWRGAGVKMLKKFPRPLDCTKLHVK